MEHNLSVLIDFENVAAGTQKEGHGKFDIRAVMRRLKDRGRILVTRAYGDWGRFAKFKQPLLEQGVNMVELTSYGSGAKNRADIAMVVDAMELAFTRDYIDTFVLISGDSDFTPLVLRLKELNKRVIGLGTRGSTSRLIIEACDEFIFYESISGQSKPTKKSKAAEPAQPLGEEDAFGLLVETLEGMSGSDPTAAGPLKQSMLRKEPSFDEKAIGYSSFARFLKEAGSRELVRLHHNASRGGFKVDLPDVSGVRADLSKPALAYRDLLAEDGVDPLTPAVRRSVVRMFKDYATERQEQKKKLTVQGAIAAVGRRGAKLEPPVPAKSVRAVVTALFRAGELIHSDGEPVRSKSVPFVVPKTGEALMLALQQFYLGVLVESDAALDDTEALAELILGAKADASDIDALLAWMEYERSSAEDGEEEPTLNMPVSHEDLDDDITRMGS